MDEPRTAAGRALASRLWDGVSMDFDEDIAAIEREAAEAVRAEVAEPGDVEALAIALQRAGVLSKSHVSYADTARCVVAALHDGRDDRGAPDVHWSHDVPAATAGREPLDALREALHPFVCGSVDTPGKPACGVMAERIAGRAALDTPDPGAS